MGVCSDTKAHVKPRRLIRIMVLDSRNHSEAVSVVKCSLLQEEGGDGVWGSPPTQLAAPSEERQ